MPRKPVYVSAALRKKCETLADGARDRARAWLGGVPPNQARRAQMKKEKAVKNPDPEPQR